MTQTHEHGPQACPECEWEGVDALDDRVTQGILDSGWYLIGVGGTEDSAAWTYSTGMSLHGEHPELAMTGLRYGIAGHCLNGTGELIRAGRRLVDGERVSEVVAGFDVLVRAVDPADPDYPMSLARRYFPDCTAIQLVWPDPQGRFPGEDGYSMPADAQPLLARPL